MRTGPHPFAPFLSVKPSWVDSSGSAGGGAQPPLNCLLGVGGVRLELRCGVLGGLLTPCLVILDTAPPAGNTGYWGGGPKEGSLATWHLEQGTPLCLLLSCFLRVLSWMHSTFSVPFELYPSCKQHRECAHPTLPATGLFTGPKPTFPAGSWQHGRTKASWTFHVSLLSYCVELEVIALRRHSTNQSLLSHLPWDGFSLLRALRWPSEAGQHGWRRYVEA